MSRRKAEMVLELVDRATRPARRFIALQRRMGRATEIANQMAKRSARTAERATNLYKRATQGLSRAQDALQRGIRKSTEQVRRQVTQMRTATGLMRGGMTDLGRGALLAGGMFAAYTSTVSLAAGAMLAPARQFERFQTVLTTTEGSAEAAQKAMSWVQNFAVKTPYELDQVMEAFVKLRSYGLNPTNGLLRTLGDTSAAMGKDVIQAVEAMADAVTGENERLKEYGIKASKVGEYFEYAYTVDGVQKTARALASDRSAIEATLTEIFNTRFGGAMELQSKTFDGMMSNVMDQWAKFQLMIMNSGVFDWMKSKLRLVLDELNRLSESGELEIWAKTIADNIMTGLTAIWQFGEDAVDLWQTVYPWLQAAADALGGWRNLALAVIAIPFRGVIIAAALSMVKFGAGAVLATKALSSIGFSSAIAGAGHFGKAMLAMANPINLVRAAFIALRVALIATGIGALVVGLAMAGLWVYNNWSGLVAFFKGFGEAFMKSLGPARPLAEGVIDAVAELWDWISKLMGPLDASAEQWTAWGEAAGAFVGEAIASIGRLFTWIGNAWDNVAAIDWGDYIPELSWDNALTALDWMSWILPIRWLDLIPGFQWSEVISGTLDWAMWVPGFVWDSFVGALTWDNLLTVLDWMSWILPIRWLDLIPGFEWSEVISGALDWAVWVPGFAWDSVVSVFTWDNALTALDWFSWLTPLRWLNFIPGFEWSSVIDLFTWDNALTALDWMSWILPIRWLDFIPGFEWSSVINDLDISQWLQFRWTDVLPDWDWSTIIPDLPDFGSMFGGKEKALDVRLVDQATTAFGKWDEGLKLVEQYKSGLMTLGQLESRLAAKVATEKDNWFKSYDVERAQEMLVVVQEAQKAGVPNAAIQTATSPVQARASGGSFSTGWLLTGEQGPELEYRNRGGFIAHNEALQKMVAMSETIKVNAANMNRPSGWLRGAAAASGIVAGASLPAAALDVSARLAAEEEAPVVARYQAERPASAPVSTGPISIEMVFNGAVDRDVLPDLEKMKDNMLEELLRRLDENARASRRREHD